MKWFQYRCDRQLIYAGLPKSDRDSLPVDDVKEQPILLLSEEGVAFEGRVIRELVAREGTTAVLRPSNGGFHLSSEMTQAFLLGQRPERFAYQPLLSETPGLRADLRLPDEVSIRSGIPDLLEWVEKEGTRFLRVIDIKHTRRAVQHHRAQVAFYSLMLRGHFHALGQQQGPLDAKAQIWHVPFESAELWTDEPSFAIRGYEEMIRDFFRRRMTSLARTTVVPGRDDSFFHLYFKCEQCKWMRHCGKTIADERPREAWDISAVPGMSHQSKRALRGQGLKTVRSLAEAEYIQSGTWALRTRGLLLQSRAKALTENRWWRLPDRHTWLMPPRIDVPIFLVVDQDPLAGHLVTAGCLVGGKMLRSPVVEVIPDLASELPALKRVLGALLQALTEIDALNAKHGNEEGLRAHIFVYETSEANDLRSALSRHLDDPEIRTGLLHLVRMFPPEEIRAPEPEYRGQHHLPASALRSVVEQVYVIPAKVSYDLARVSHALANADPPLEHPYLPEPPFARPFSARLSIEVARRLSTSAELVERTRGDVEARLRAMASLADWILADEERAEESFLRLRKPPFRFQAQFHPLNAIDLDVLLSQELLQSRAERLAALVELARPASERIERLNCCANLKLKDVTGQGAKTLEFSVPRRSRQAEISPGSFGLILTDDDPDIRLDPTLWQQCGVWLPPRRNMRSDLLRIKIRKRAWESPTMRRLIKETPQDGWFLDKAHVDINTPRMETLLRFLAVQA